MDALNAAFAAWIAFLSALSVDTDVVLNAPATDAQITVLEESIGYKLPDDLRGLYKITNGQQDPHHVEPRTGGYAVNLLGHYDFLTIEQALEAYQFQLEIRADSGSILDDEITAPPGHPVDPVQWKKGWLPIAGSGANHIAIDLDPPPGGNYGQLISIGADEFERRVLATTLTEFFTTATNDTKTDECSIEYGTPDTSGEHVPEEYRINLNGYIMYITEEWNHPYYRDNCEERKHMQTLAEQNDEQPTYLQRTDQLTVELGEWLLVQGVDEESISRITDFSMMELPIILQAQAGMFFDDMPDWLVPGGQIPQELIDSDDFSAEEFPNGIIPLDFQLPDPLDSIYLDHLAFKLACLEGSSTSSLGNLHSNEYQLFHRYLVEQGVWTTDEYQRAESAMQNLPSVQVTKDDAGNVSFCENAEEDAGQTTG